MQEIINSGEDVLVFYNDKASFNAFARIQQENDNSMMRYSVGSGSNGTSSSNGFNSSSLGDSDDDPDGIPGMERGPNENVDFLHLLS